MKSLFHFLTKFWPSEPGTFTDESSVKLDWLVRLRWCAIPIQVLFGYLGFRYVLLYTNWSHPYFLTVTSIILFNFYSIALLRSENPLSPWALFQQVSFDTLAYCALLIFSGGIRNPFVPLLFVHALIGTMLVPRKQTTAFLGVLIFSVWSLFLFPDLQIISSEFYVLDYLPAIVMALSLVLVWGLTSWLSQLLSHFRKQVEDAKSRKERINHLLALGALTAEFSHQFATPLNTIKMRSARLLRKSTPENKAEIGVIDEAINCCEAILRDMTDANLDSSMLAFEEVDSAKLISSIISQWGRNYPSAQVELKNVLPETTYVKIPTKVFSRSFANLLDNAFSQTAKDMRIEVQLERFKNMVCISVLDRGPGWSDEIKKHGIQPFQSRRPGGTGLGLFNCQSLSEIIDGRFDLLDRVGGGAVVKFSIPVSRV